MSSRTASTQQTQEAEEDDVLVEDDHQAPPVLGRVDDVATNREVKGAAVAGALVGVTMELCATGVVLTPPGALLLGATAGAAYIAKKDEGGLGEIARKSGEKVANAAERLRETTDHMRDESTTLDQAATNVERVVQTVGTSTKRAAQKLGRSTQWMIRRANGGTTLSSSCVDEKKEHQEEEEVVIEENLSEKNKNSLQMKKEESFSTASNQASSSSSSSMERVVQTVGTSTIRAARTVSQSTKWMIRRAGNLSANQKEDNQQVEENQEHLPEKDGGKEAEKDVEGETEKDI